MRVATGAHRFDPCGGCTARVNRYAPGRARSRSATEAIILSTAGGSIRATAQSRSVFPTDNEGLPDKCVPRSFLLSGAQGLLTFVARTARWAQRCCGNALAVATSAPVEHRSSYTDASRDRDSAIRERGQCPSRAGNGRGRIGPRRCTPVRCRPVRCRGRRRGDAGAHSRLAGVCGVGA